MIINYVTFPDPVLGDGRKLGAATAQTTSITNVVRTYIRRFGETYTLSFDRLTTEQLSTLLDMMNADMIISGLINGTFYSLAQPVEVTEGKYWCSITLTLRKVQ